MDIDKLCWWLHWHGPLIIPTLFALGITTLDRP